ncbi:MAG: hypothetical protein R2852_06510 [Bacteroidia bacterium]
MYRLPGIHGYTYLDLNNNCKFDAFDKALPGIKIMNDSNTMIGISNSNGEYFIATDKKDSSICILIIITLPSAPTAQVLKNTSSTSMAIPFIKM